MSDLAAFLEGRSKSVKAKCPAARLIDSIRTENDVVADQLESLIASEFPITKIHSNLRKAGYSIARDTLTMHKYARCVCEE